MKYGKGRGRGKGITKSRKPVSRKPVAKSKSFVTKGANRGEGIASYNVKSEPFPRVLLTKCKYGGKATIDTTNADQAYSVVYRMNSIYSPAVTSDHTVTGHSVLATMYDQYWVLGAKVTVNFYNVLYDGMHVGCRLRVNGNDPVAGENLSTLKGKSLTYEGIINATGSQKKSFSFYIKPWSLVGCSKLEYMANSGTYSSAISANPGAASTCVLDVFALSQLALNTVEYEIQIEYYTKLYSRKEFNYTNI